MAFKDFATKGGSLLLVPYDKIVDNPRNVREDYGDISDLANDINQNGLKLPLIIQRNQRNDEAAVLVDGHRRIRAIKYAVEKLGSPIKQVECKFEAEGTNEGDRLISMFSTGMNVKPLTDLEQAKVIKRLVDLSWSIKDIATKINRKQKAIKTLLELHAAPLAIREKVEKKKLSTSAAVKLSKAPAEKQAEVLKDTESKKVGVKEVEKATKGVTSQISSRAIKLKLAKVRKILEKGEEPKYWQGVEFGIELCLGLKDLPPQE